MRSTLPPPLATLLLRRLAPGEEALAGDLQEEFCSGRSRSWYWWQVGVAIAFDAWRDLRQHKVRAVGTIVVALSVYYAFGISAAVIVNDINRTLTTHVPTWTLDYGVYQTVESILWALVVSWATGVNAMALNRRHRTIALCAVILYVLLVELSWWQIVPRWFRPDGLRTWVMFTMTLVAMAKIAGLVAGFTAFLPRPEERQRGAPYE